MGKNNRKNRYFSQCLSAEIWGKNTISSGIFSLPTKPVVFPKKSALPHFGGQIQLDFLRTAVILAGCL
jgi:hypothetical protein